MFSMNKKLQPPAQNKDVNTNDKKTITPGKKGTFFSDLNAVYLIGGRFPSLRLWKRKN